MERPTWRGTEAPSLKPASVGRGGNEHLPMSTTPACKSSSWGSGHRGAEISHPWGVRFEFIRESSKWLYYATMTNLDSILKSRDATLPTKVCLVKAMVFPVVMYGCESWTMRKAECWKIDAFELWCWRRLLRVPWTARRSNQSILKEINPEYSLEGLMLKLKLQFLATWCKKTDSLEKTLMLGKIEGRRWQQRMR